MHNFIRIPNISQTKLLQVEPLTDQLYSETQLQTLMKYQPMVFGTLATTKCSFVKELFTVTIKLFKN